MIPNDINSPYYLPTPTGLGPKEPPLEITSPQARDPNSPFTPVNLRTPERQEEPPSPFEVEGVETPDAITAEEKGWTLVRISAMSPITFKDISLIQGIRRHIKELNMAKADKDNPVYLYTTHAYRVILCYQQNDTHLKTVSITCKFLLDDKKIDSLKLSNDTDVEQPNDGSSNVYFDFKIPNTCRPTHFLRGSLYRLQIIVSSGTEQLFSLESAPIKILTRKVSILMKDHQEQRKEQRKRKLSQEQGSTVPSLLDIPNSADKEPPLKRIGFGKEKIDLTQLLRESSAQNEKEIEQLKAEVERLKKELADHKTAINGLIEK